MHVKYENIFIIYIGDKQPGKVYLHRNVYTDDDQYYMSFKPDEKGNSEKTVKKMENCAMEVHEWLIENKLIKSDGNTAIYSIDAKRNQTSEFGHPVNKLSIFVCIWTDI